MSHLQGIGQTEELAIVELIGLCSGTLEKSKQESIAVIENVTVGGSIAEIEEFTNVLLVFVDAGIKKVLILTSAVMDLQTIPSDLLVKVQPGARSIQTLQMQVCLHN